MDLNTFEIRDNCRKNLNKYTIKAFSIIPKIDNPLLLDMGCGTGVPTLALMEVCNGKIYAVDSDNSSLFWLKEKVKKLNYSDRIRIIHASVFNNDLFDKKFDIVLAEGLLNVIGFEKGLAILIKYLKNNGYIIIHDELNNDTEKRIIFERCNLELINSFELNENVWWNDYYYYLEKAIKQIDNNSLFQKEINEIVEYKKNPKIFRSIYYVLHK